MWFYSLPKHDQLRLPAEKRCANYLGALGCGSIATRARIDAMRTVNVNL